MPISPTGKTKPGCGHNTQLGFTLVEILAVLLIIGLMAGAVVMNMPPKQDPLHKQGELLATRIQIAAQSGLVEGQSIGIIFHEQSYDIVRYFNETWNVTQEFEYGVDNSKPVISLTLNAAKIDLEQAEKTGIPTIRYDTTGLGTSFELQLEDGLSRFIINGRVDGSINAEPVL